MNDEDSDWIPLDEATTYVEVTKKCYREKAIDLLREAADGLKLKSRTVNPSPRWIECHIAGEKVFYSDGDKELNSTARTYLRFANPNQRHRKSDQAQFQIGSTWRLTISGQMEFPRA